MDVFRSQRYFPLVKVYTVILPSAPQRSGQLRTRSASPLALVSGCSAAPRRLAASLCKFAYNHAVSQSKETRRRAEENDEQTGQTFRELISQGTASQQKNKPTQRHECSQQLQLDVCSLGDRTSNETRGNGV
ncbi:uncharacterized [Tachysurus ichikawai]